MDGFDDFTPVEMAILDTLSDHVVARGGEVLVTLPWDEGRPELFAASRPPREHLLGRGFVEEKLQGFRRRPGTSLERLALGLFAPAETSPVPSDGSVQRILAGDDEDEAEAVARLARHLHDEEGLLRGWRDLGVVVRRPDSAASRLLAAFDRMKIPARLVVGGESLASEAIVRALDGPLRVLAGTTGGATFDPAGLLPWLRWTATATGDAGALGLVDRMEIRWRREGWPFDLAAFLADAAAALPAAAELSRLGGELARERDWPGVEAVLAQAIRRLAPLPPSGGLDADGRPQDAGADRRLRRAAAARTRVLDLLAELARASGRTGLGAPIDPPQAVASLLDAVEHAAFAPRDRRLDVVNVLDFEEARYWELPVVVVCGLAQGQVPLLAREDLLLGDEDRRGLRAAEGLRAAADEGPPDARTTPLLRRAHPRDAPPRPGALRLRRRRRPTRAFALPP